MTIQRFIFLVLPVRALLEIIRRIDTIKDNCYGWLLSCKKFLINSWKFVLKIIIEYKNISGGNLILFNVSARNNIPVLMNYIDLYG